MKKAGQLLLGVVAIGIWGYVFISFFGIGKDDSKSASLVVHDLGDVKEEIKEESIRLLLNYRDPFLGSLKRSYVSDGRSVNYSNGSVQRKPQVKPQVKEEIKPVDLSFISFHGLITNPSTGKKVALVTVNGSQQMVAEKDKINDVLFLHNAKDSIGIEYGKKKYFIKRKI